MEKIRDLKDLLIEQLREMYSAEVHLGELAYLPNRITDKQLEKVVQDYLNVVQDQIMRLRQIFELLFTQKRGEYSESMAAMIQTIDNLMERSDGPEITDAAVVTGLQHIMHYKIAGYGATCTYLKDLGFIDEARILHRNLNAEKESDRLLAVLADTFINPKVIEVH